MPAVNMLRGTYAEISLGALRRNIRAALAYFGAEVKLLVVVKADAYGHGIAAVSLVAQQEGAHWLGVATAEEGISVRMAGITLPVLVFAALNEQGMEAAARYALTVAIADVRGARLAARAAGKHGIVIDCHLKLDTGMNRIGARSEPEVAAILQELTDSPGVRLSGVFTHFADAHNEDSRYTQWQAVRFRALSNSLPQGLIRHISATSAAMRRRDLHLDMVRLGIGIYGCPPADAHIRMEPCMRLVAEVSFVKDIVAGDCISYGCTFQAQDAMRVATIAAGYGDGYNRRLSGRGRVLLHGVSCPILGRVCMDQFMVDVSRVPQVLPGDSAILLGQSGDERITADEIAGLLDTISYEVLLSPTARVPRVYTDEEEV